MKANEFVKKYGWDAAIDLWCGAFDLYNNDLQILNGMVCSFSNNQFLFDLVDLKRLIESYELVKEHGSLERAKMYAESMYTAPEVVERMKQAIKDVESCL